MTSSRSGIRQGLCIGLSLVLAMSPAFAQPAAPKALNIVIVVGGRITGACVGFDWLLTVAYVPPATAPPTTAIRIQNFADANTPPATAAAAAAFTIPNEVEAVSP